MRTCTITFLLTGYGPSLSGTCSLYVGCMQHVLSVLQERLSLPAPTVASEFFTHAEMEEAAKFKKVTKKKRKLRKKVTVTADDLLGLEADTDADLGSR